MTEAISREIVRKSRVLIAEDDSDAREVLASALRAIDIEVDVVADGGRLLVAVASKYRIGSAAPPIDLMVLDVAMPVCSGLAVLEALRSARWITPVVVITGWDTPLVRATTDRLKATLMLKPLELTTFQQTVQRLLFPSVQLAETALREVDVVPVSRVKPSAPIDEKPERSPS
jgi:two-component system response regulator TctD